MLKAEITLRKSGQFLPPYEIRYIKTNLYYLYYNYYCFNVLQIVHKEQHNME